MNKIILILLNLLGFEFDSPKNDLRKTSNREDFKHELNVFVGMNFDIICIAVILIGSLIFVFVCFQLCGLSAVESGGMRNFINRGLV